MASAMTTAKSMGKAIAMAMGGGHGEGQGHGHGYGRDRRRCQGQGVCSPTLALSTSLAAVEALVFDVISQALFFPMNTGLL